MSEFRGNRRGPAPDVGCGLAGVLPAGSPVVLLRRRWFVRRECVGMYASRSGAMAVAFVSYDARCRNRPMVRKRPLPIGGTIAQPAVRRAGTECAGSGPRGNRGPEVAVARDRPPRRSSGTASNVRTAAPPDDIVRQHGPEQGAGAWS